jgi:transcriptional regulator with XRE-family HTH domain
MKQKLPVPRTRNQLWLARKRLGLGQKQVAFLLDKSIDKISRYEKGARIPGLQTALGFEIIFGVPSSVLFRDLHDQLQEEIATRLNSSRTLQHALSGHWDGYDKIGAWCSYAELLKSPMLADVDKDRIRSHVIKLVRDLAYS